MRPAPPRSLGARALPVLSVLLAGALSSVEAQLRPIDPMPWDALDGGSVSVTAGVAAYAGQRASLAGTRGTLVEIGTFAAFWPQGRVVLELSGTALRVFSDDSTYAPPVGSARAPDGRRRIDVGEQGVSTMVLFTDPGSSLLAGLRFGVRLPTTDDLAGLGRDRTDFFSTLGGRWRRGSVDLRAEAGIGVFGTRDPTREQVDPVLVAGAALWDAGSVRLGLWALGQHDTRRGEPLRGTEDLGEVRLSAEMTRHPHLRVVLVRGFARHSPALGLQAEWGVRF